MILEINRFHFINCQDSKFLPVLGAWRHHFNHWSDRGAYDLKYVGVLGMNFIRCREEENYQPRVANLPEGIRIYPFLVDLKDEADLIHL